MAIFTKTSLFLVSILVAMVMTAEEDGVDVYGLINTNVSIIWSIDTSKCTEKSHMIDIYKETKKPDDDSTIFDIQVVESFPCKNFTKRFYNEDGMYTKSVNGYNVSVFAKSATDLSLIVWNVQVEDSGVYNMQIFKIQNKIKRTLSVKNPMDLQVDLQVADQKLIENEKDSVSINRRTDDPKILVVTPKTNAPDNFQIIMIGLPSEKENTTNCTSSVLCRLTLQPLSTDDSEIMVKVWFTDVQGAEAAEVLSVQITGLKNWHIGLIVLFVLLTIVGIIIALILYAHHHKRCCFDPEKPVIPAFVARQSGDIPPPDLKAPHFDVVLIYSTENEKLAKWVKQQLATIKLEDKKRSIAVCVPDDLDFVQSKMDMCGEAIKRSTYIFLLMTKEFVEDKEALLHKDETLIESLENEDKRWCLVPLHTLSKSQRNKNESEEGFVYPYGLRSLVGVDISEIIQDQGGKGKRENKEKIDEVLDKITKLVEQRQNYKHDREKVQADELEKWKKEHKAEKDLESANQKTGTGDKAVTMEQNEINEMKDLKNSKEKAVTNDEVAPLLPGAGDAATYIDVRQPTVQPGSDVPVQAVQPNPPQQAQTPESDDGLGVSYKLDEVVADSQGDMTRI